MHFEVFGVICLLFACHLLIPLKNLNHHADNVVGSLSAFSVPILDRSQRDAEAVSELGLFEIILGTDAPDTKLLGIAYSEICCCFHVILLFSGGPVARPLVGVYLRYLAA